MNHVVTLPVAIGVVVAVALVVVGFLAGRVTRHGGGGPRPVEATRGLPEGGFDLSSAGRRLVEVMPDAVMILGPTGVIRYASAQAALLPIGDGPRLSSRILMDILSQVVADGRTREREVSVPRRDGRAVTRESGRGVDPDDASDSMNAHLRVRVARVDENDYAMFIKDVTEQRRFESLRRDFVTNVSHELKTPAGAISLLAETIHDAADDSHAVRYFSSRITTESSRLVELVGRLIDLQRADIADPVLDLHPVDVLVVVEDAVKRTMVQARAKGIDVRVSVDGRLVGSPGTDADSASMRNSSVQNSSVRNSSGQAASEGEASEGGASEGSTDGTGVRSGYVVRADSEALVVAVKNLVENAVRYSASGTVVEVAVGGGNGRVSIRVVDRGIGIPREALGRIFERFYRVDPARSRSTGGSGLGLSIVKHCVQECGGTITVWSREGEGSTFTIELPALSDAEADADADPDSDPESDSDDDGSSAPPGASGAIAASDDGGAAVSGAAEDAEDAEDVGDVGTQPVDGSSDNGTVMGDDIDDTRVDSRG